MPQENQMERNMEMPLYERENELLAKVWARVSPPEEQGMQCECRNSVHDWAGPMVTFLADEYADAQYYQKMARRYPVRSTVFSSLAAEELRHAKQLAAALFLRGGVRIPPAQGQRPISLPEYCDALRIRILAEQQGEASYRAAAKNAPDETLRQLYIALAEDEHRHGQTLHKLLENAM